MRLVLAYSSVALLLTTQCNTFIVQSVGCLSTQHPPPTTPRCSGALHPPPITHRCSGPDTHHPWVLRAGHPPPSKIMGPHSAPVDPRGPPWVRHGGHMDPAGPVNTYPPCPHSLWSLWSTNTHKTHTHTYTYMIGYIYIRLSVCD